MQISVKADIQSASRYLDEVQRKQLPFAIASSLTKTAQAAQVEATRQLDKKLDRPTPFTRKAIAIARATKTNQTAEVFIKDIQWQYLKFQIEGGRRETRGKGTGVPTSAARLNKYGNIPNRRAGLVKKKSQFIGTIRGITGVWERVAGSIRLIIALEKAPEYTAGRFPFRKIVEGVARSRFARIFADNLDRALRTARR